MRRREFIGALISASLWPGPASAQQLSNSRSVPVVGFLSSRAPQTETHLVAAFLKGLNEHDYVEGNNVGIEYRWAEGHYDRLPALAQDLVSRQVAVIVTAGGIQTAQAAKAATASIPIVFTTGDDPVERGLVASLNQPGGNATGVAVFVTSLLPKRLGLLHELVPQASSIGFLMNPLGPGAEAQLTDVQNAAGLLNVRLEVARSRSAVEIEQAFSLFAERKTRALLLAADPFFQVQRAQLVSLAAQHAIPTMYEWREFVDAGGLISYSPRRSETMRQMGVYAARILQGVKPADLPVVRAVQFELVINLKTAKAMHLAIPAGLLARADEVIE